jgi:hypothetical protein
MQIYATKCRLQLQNWYNIILGHMVVCATNMQLVVYKMDTCYKNHDLS